MNGKTTFVLLAILCLLGLVEPDRGNVHTGTGVEVGYFDQQLAELDDRTPVVEAVRPPRKEFNEQQRRDLLARFGLIGDTSLQDVGSLSGGERCRAALARLAAADANLLVLDEPTNHLDLWARDALERSLTAFKGTVLFVSHDRFFVNRVADHLLVVEPGRVGFLTTEPCRTRGSLDVFRQTATARKHQFEAGVRQSRQMLGDSAPAEDPLSHWRASEQ